MTVFAPKGGVGKTTIAFNLAVALGQLDQRTVLDRRQPPVRRPALAAQGPGRRAVDPRPADRPDRRVGPERRPVARSVGDRHPARAAAHRDGRDGHRARRREDAVAAAPRLRVRSSSTCRAISTTSTSRSSTRATRSSRSSPTTRRRSTTRSRWPTRSARSATRRPRSATSSTAPTRRAASTRSTSSGRSAACPSTRSCPTAGSSSSRTTRACRSCWPAPTRQISQDVMRIAGELLNVGPRRGRGRAVLSRAMSDPRPIGVFDSGVGGLTVLREIIRRSPRESTIYLGDNARAPYGVRSDDEVLAFSTQSLDVLVERDVKAIVVACNTSTAVAIGGAPAALRPADPGRHPAGRIGGRAGHPQSPRRRHRDAGDDPLARLLRGDQGREPGGRGLRARDADARAAGRGGRPERARPPRPRSPRRSRRCSASATRPASRSSRARPARRSTRSCSAAPTTRCCAPIIAGGRGRPRRDRRLGDGHRVGAGRAARHQRARGWRRA